MKKKENRLTTRDTYQLSYDMGLNQWLKTFLLITMILLFATHCSYAYFDSFTSETFKNSATTARWEAYGDGEVRLPLDWSNISNDLKQEYGSVGALYSIGFGSGEFAKIIGHLGMLNLNTSQSPKWSWDAEELPLNQGGILKKIVLRGNSIGYALGDNSTIYSWNGSTWSDQSPSFGEDINDFWLNTAGNNGIGVGNGGLLFSWVATSGGFTEMPGSKTLTTAAINSVWAIETLLTTSAFAVTESGFILHYTNHDNWNLCSSLTYEGLTPLNDIHMLLTSEGYIVGDNNKIFTFESTNMTWEVSPQSGSFTGDLNTVWATTNTNVWAAGTGGLLIHYNGTPWPERPESRNFLTSDINDIWLPIATFGVIVTSDQEVYFWNGSTIVKQDVNSYFTTKDLNSIDWYEDDLVIIGGEDGWLWQLIPSIKNVSFMANLGATIIDVAIQKFNEGYACFETTNPIKFNGVSWSDLIPTNMSPTYSFDMADSNDIYFIGQPAPPLSTSYIYSWDGTTATAMNGSENTGFMATGNDIWKTISMYKDSMTPEGFAASRNGQIARYVSSSATWSQHASTGAKLNKVTTLFQDLAYAAGDDGEIYQYAGDGNGWQPMPGIASDSTIYGLYMHEKGEGIAVGKNTTLSSPVFYYCEDEVWNNVVVPDPSSLRYFTDVVMRNRLKGLVTGTSGTVFSYGILYDSIATVESEVAESVDAPEIFYAATIKADEVLNSGSITYSISANNGLTWEPAANGNTHVFAETARGSEIKWRAIIKSAADRKSSPVIKSLTIEAISDPGSITDPGQPEHYDSDATIGWDNDTKVSFTWEASFSPIGIEKYEIWLSENNGPYTNETYSGKPFVDLYSLKDGKSYSIYVIPYNKFNIAGSASLPSLAVKIDRTAPSAPQAYQTSYEVDANSISIKLSFPSGDANFSYYEIKGGALGDSYRKTNKTNDFEFPLKQNARQGLFIRGVDIAGNKGLPLQIDVYEDSSPHISSGYAPYHVDDTSKPGYDDDGKVKFKWERNTDINTTAYAVYLSYNSGEYFKNIQTIDPEVEISIGDGNSVSIKVAAINSYGDEGDMTEPSQTIIVDLKNPVLEIIDPIPDEEFEPEDIEYFLVTVSELVDKLPLEKGRVFSLYNDNDGDLELDVVYKEEEGLIYVYPVEQLKHGRTYKLSIKKNFVMDKAGRKPDIEESFSFMSKDAGPLEVSKFLPYPNPAGAGGGRIFFTLNRDIEDSKLEIYAVTGKKVINILDGPIYEGQNLFFWDGIDKDGMTVPNGTYLMILSIYWKMDSNDNVRKAEYRQKISVLR